MGWEVRWVIENRVVFERIYGDHTLEELEDVTRVLTEEYLNAGIAPVHVIVDMSALKTYPTNIPIVQKTSTSFLRNKNLGWFLMNGADSVLLRSVVTTVLYALRIRFHYSNTLEDAIVFLKRVDETLGDPESET